MKFSPKKFAPNFQMLNRTWAFRKIEWKMQKEDQTWLKHELFWFKDYVQNEGRKSKTLKVETDKEEVFSPKTFATFYFVFANEGQVTRLGTSAKCGFWCPSFLHNECKKALFFFSCFFSFGKTNVPANVSGGKGSSPKNIFWINFLLFTKLQLVTFINPQRKAI